MVTERTPITTDQMKLVLDVASLLAMTADLDALLTRICTAGTSLVSCERASIFLHDPKTGELWTKVALGAKEIRVPSTAGIVGHVFQTNETLLVPEPYQDARFNREVDKRNGFITRNLLTVPVKDLTRRQIGVLQAVNRIGGAFSENDIMLMEILADQAGVAIQRYRLQIEAVRAAGMDHEMELAQKVQMAMIPATPPEVPGLSAVGWAQTASVTGGDAYDLWAMPDGRMGIFLGDASGHGIAPALVVSQARTLIRALSEINCDPLWLLSRVNARLACDLEPGMFVTAFMGCVAGDGALKWSSAGHGPFFMRPSRNENVRVLEPLGPPIGVLPELVCDQAPDLPLGPGGSLIVMSDGVFEARSARGELFDLDRVIALLDDTRQASPEQQIRAVRDAMLKWQGKVEPVDDQTVVIIQRNDG
ncbi:MAG TPA: GAF domain-containing SpoIIE family protein phosphatase [Tepidisphaeraceae bacterium]|jgi:serine phosphatase RsbU (regulator of sigma subunit)|nr:GAF domain-containing SpoIIE family protein phosphatase [Tepidisphaeraceae bacterium]